MLNGGASITGTSGADGAKPVCNQDAKRGILDGEGRDLGPEQNHRDVDGPQPEITARSHRDGAGAEDKHQRRPAVAGDGDVFRNGFSDAAAYSAASSRASA